MILGVPQTFALASPLAHIIALLGARATSAYPGCLRAPALSLAQKKPVWPTEHDKQGRTDGLASPSCVDFHNASIFQRALPAAARRERGIRQRENREYETERIGEYVGARSGGNR